MRSRPGYPVLREVVRIQPRPLLAGVLAGLAWQICVAAVPVVIGIVVDRAVVDGKLSAAWWGALALLGLGVATAVTDSGRHWWESACGARTRTHLRERIGAAALRADADERDRWPPSELVGRSTADVDAVAAAAESVSWIVAQAVVIPLIIGALVVIDPLLALTAVLASAFAVVAMWRASLAWERHSEATQGAMAAYIADAHAVLEGFAAIRGAGADAGVLAGIERRSAEVRDRSVQAGRWWLLFTPVMEVLSGIGVVALLWVGGERVVTGDLGVGEVVAAIGLAVVLVEPMGSVGYGIVTLRSAIVAADRIAEVGDPAPVVAPPAAPPTRVVGAVAALGLEVERVALRYPGRSGRALSEVDHVFPLGRLTLVRGPVGSGKTTLAEVLAGERLPDSGEVRWQGRALRTLPADERRRAVLRLGTEPFLLAESLAANLRLGTPEASDADLLAALRLVTADDLLSALPAGLDTVLADRGTSLSGGERQRIALARAVLARPDVLILDGATGGLEPSREHAVIRDLAGAWRHGVLVVVSANPLLLDLADDVLTLPAPDWHADGPGPDRVATGR